MLYSIILILFTLFLLASYSLFVGFSIIIFFIFEIYNYFYLFPADIYKQHCASEKLGWANLSLIKPL